MDGRMATASCVAPFVSLMNRSYLIGGEREQGAPVGWCEVGIRIGTFRCNFKLDVKIVAGQKTQLELWLIGLYFFQVLNV